MLQSKKNIDLSFDMNLLDTNNIRNKHISYLKTDECIGSNIRNGIYWELWMLKYFQENYITNTNMIDLGGNIGTSTLLMSEVLSNNCKIFTFEPIYDDILFKNIIDNNLNDKIELYPYGVGNKQEILKMKKVIFNSNINFGAMSIIHNLENNDDSLEINIVPLDYFKFENVSVIKIDVEAMEIQVLEGSYELIKCCKPTIIIETYQIDEFKESEIFKKLIDLGYNINPIPEGHADYIMKI
uniref:Methyltransferase FkbM domain-containing protein n=1 Tax=viral metagenome TaxID=1070528 RepID=A0A6C0LDY6_9ZZZZ